MRSFESRTVGVSLLQVAVSRSVFLIILLTPDQMREQTSAHGLVRATYSHVSRLARRFSFVRETYGSVSPLTPRNLFFLASLRVVDEVDEGITRIANFTKVSEDVLTSATNIAIACPLSWCTSFLRVPLRLPSTAKNLGGCGPVSVLCRWQHRSHPR